jgi:hypothetical protein
MNGNWGWECYYYVATVGCAELTYQEEHCIVECVTLDLAMLDFDSVLYTGIKYYILAR